MCPRGGWLLASLTPHHHPTPQHTHPLEMYVKGDLVFFKELPLGDKCQVMVELHPWDRKEKACWGLPGRAGNPTRVPIPEAGLLAAGMELGILSEAGRWRSPARDTDPVPGPRSQAAGIITDSCQRGQFVGLQRLGMCRSGPAPHAFCLQVSAPSPPSPTSQQQGGCNRGRFCFGGTRKRLVECDLASALSDLSLCAAVLSFVLGAPETDTGCLCIWELLCVLFLLNSFFFGGWGETWHQLKVLVVSADWSVRQLGGLRAAVGSLFESPAWSAGHSRQEFAQLVKHTCSRQRPPHPMLDLQSWHRLDFLSPLIPCGWSQHRYRLDLTCWGIFSSHSAPCKALWI